MAVEYELEDEQLWYRDAVVYSLDVKTFNDSNGDGWGDFRGLIDRIDYLDSLGVDCLWLRPFYPSPLQDNGYDVADYYDVDPRLGTLEEFSEFVDLAHDHGIRVLTDMVFNHTSIEHEWFKQARDWDSEYHDYYLWTGDVEDAYNTINIFPEYEDGVWSWDEEAGLHYFHQFYHFQPDLNVANPAVRDEIHDILRFWLELGVDGFRIDAAHPMVQPKGHNGTHIEDPAWLFSEMREVVRETKEDAILLAEADDQPDQLEHYFADGEGFDLLFNFVINSHLVYGLAVKDTWPLERAYEVLPDTPYPTQWANFLRNHDEFNLLKLPQEAFDHAREFLGTDDSWIFGRGHRLRLADLCDGDHDRIACAHSLVLSLPGTPVLNAGDEIGMGADLSVPERESVRTPMQWTNDHNAGFSTADPEDLYNPIRDDWQFGYENVNVEQQSVDPDSLLNRIRRLVDARRQSPEVSAGEFSIVYVEPKDVWVHRFDYGDTVLLIAHSIADESREVDVYFDADDDTTEAVVGTADYLIHDDGDSCTFFLEPCEYVWIRGQRV